ncbi:MAG: M23 family metallopeptidase [Balneola sp.]
MNKERFQNNRVASIRPLWIILLIFSGFTPIQYNSVTIKEVDKENGVVLIGINSNQYPVTIELDLKLKNMSSSKNNPIIKVVPAKSELVLIELEVEEPGSSGVWEYKFKYYQGSIYAKHNDKIAYRLPYKIGEKYRLDQGYNGKFSHRGESRHSLDFNMKEGTEVYSSRAGMVVDFKDEYSEGGSDKSLLDKANYVTILHDDGTFARYSHLQKNGVSVKIGQKVKAGERIGYSGATGYVTGPHLHFTVLKANRGGGSISIPVKFATKDGIIALKEKETYTAY